MRRALACLGLVLAMLADVGAAAGVPITGDPEIDAEPELVNPRIVDLEVEGGEDTWHPENDFRLTWNIDAKPGLVARDIVAIHYRVVDRLGVVVAPAVELPSSARSTGRLRIAPGQPPPAPGRYTAEVWAQARSGDGPHAEAALRFDDRRPASAPPFPGPGWIRGDAEAVLRIAHPASPLPLSGIRGYAVSVRQGSAAPPCEDLHRCVEEEVDLPGGIGDDTLALGVLPEGTHVASVVAVSGSGVRSELAESVEIRVDATRPDLALSGTGEGWSNQPVRVVARATDALSGMAASGPAGPRTTLAVDGGTPTVVQGDEAAAIVAGSGVHTVAAGARDAAGNVRGEDDEAPPLSAAVRIDEAPPAVSFARAGDPAEPELIEASVSDGLSGPHPARGAIAVRPAGSGRPFEPIATTVLPGRLLAHWDSDSYPRGEYEFRATGYDLAGNPTSSVLRASGARMVLANPVKAGTAIRFGFGGRRLVWHRCVRSGEGRRCRREVIEAFDRRPATRVIPFGQGLQVGGRLVSASGAPLPGFAVELIESFDGGAGTRTRTTQLVTDPEGVFLARLEPGPSRRVEARFAGNRLLTRAAGRSVRLDVQTAVHLRASSARAAIGGAPVVFSGRIGHLDATIPSYGRPIQFQFRLPGSPWTEFRTVQTDAEGRFRYPYAFSDDDSRGVRFLFRAYAPPQPGWPYEPAVSRPVAVTGY